MPGSSSVPPIGSTGPNRRSFLTLTGVSAAAFALGAGRAVAADERTASVPADPFRLGVASGDPEPERPGGPVPARRRLR